MTLIKRNDVMFPNLWNDFFDNDWLGTPNVAQAGISVPAVNVRETTDNYKIEMAAAGMKKGDFSINLNNGALTISAEKKSETSDEGKDGSYTRREFNYSSFRRVFNLPESAEADKISASYNDGVLNITIPKKEEAKPKPVKMIEIS